MSQDGAPIGRFLVVAKCPPVQSSGTSIVLRRLLENFSDQEVVLMGRSPDRSLRFPASTLHYPVVRIPSLPGGIRGERYWRLLSVIPGLVAGRRAVRQYNPSALLVVYPDDIALLTGYWLHRISGLPLLAYFCDLYMEDLRSGWETALARWLQPRVFAAAARIVAVNQGMADYYRERYGVAPLCLPACINATIGGFRGVPDPGRPFVVGYSGNVNATRADSLRALVGAIGGDPAYAIRYFTPQKPDFLRAHGIWAENASRTFLSDESELVRQLSACDALFLPLTFAVAEHSRDQLATCFGIKAYEYFMSQRPVLLHCPGDYFIARFFRTWGCGLVVDDPSPAALAASLGSLRSDGSLRASLVQNALRAARQFEGKRIAREFRGALRDLTAGEGEWRR
jgi:glycosyltransferase involved in cell wall biosynthesis